METSICQFHTNIDCMKRFMSNISGLQIRPMANDTVEVYRDSELSVVLRVCSCRWTFTNGATPILHCDLHLTLDWENIIEFIKAMRSHNIV